MAANALTIGSRYANVKMRALQGQSSYQRYNLQGFLKSFDGLMVAFRPGHPNRSARETANAGVDKSGSQIVRLNEALQLALEIDAGSKAKCI